MIAKCVPIKALITGLILFGLITTSRVSSGLFGQEIDGDYLSIADGMASPEVYDVFQDSYGLIWIGTTNGLQKHDGYSFESFKYDSGKPNSILNNVIWDVVEDDDHNIWVSTDIGVARLDRFTKKFTNYNFKEIFNLPDITARVFNLYIDSNKRIWASCRRFELAYFDQENDTWVLAKYDLPDSLKDRNLIDFLSFALEEDSKGNLWHGSMAYGLMCRKKNEERFKPVSIIFEDTVAFSTSDFITDLYADRDDQIWITTKTGVYKYDPEANHLKMLKNYDENAGDLWNALNCIMEDPEGNIWIANNFRGILKFEGNSDKFEHIPVKNVFRVKGIGMNVTWTKMMVDRSGVFWIGSRTTGILKYDPERKPFAHFTHDEENPKSIGMDAVFGVYASTAHANTIYVGTRGKGLDIYDEKAQTFEHVVYDAVSDAYTGAVRSVGEQSDGTILLGTWGDGIIELDANKKEKRRFQYDENSSNSISDNMVRVIKKDERNKFWIGTNNGLNYFDPVSGRFERIKSFFTRTYSDELVSKIESWAGTEKSVAEILRVKNDQDLTRSFEVKTTGNYLIASIGEGDVGSMADFGFLQNEADGTIWTSDLVIHSNHAGGSQKNRIEIEQIELTPGKYKLNYHSDDSHNYGSWNEPSPSQTDLYGILIVELSDTAEQAEVEYLLNKRTEELVISANNIFDLELRGDYLWIATNNTGVDRVDLRDNSVKNYHLDRESDNSIGSNVIMGLDFDENGILWIATAAGLNRLDPETEIFTLYDETDGLPTNLTEAVVAGKDGELWISTQNGLSQMVTNRELDKVTFINYSSEDGLGGDIFLSHCAAVSESGRFYFGGDHGLNVVSKIKGNEVPPDIIISDLLISNRSVTDMGETSPLTSELLSTEAVTFSNKQNNLSFEFAALHYADPKKNQYAHMLKGYDSDWIYDNRNHATYSNLEPGKYEFMVRASNAYGVWNEEGKSLLITITPPWYKTWWAYGSFAMVLGGFLYAMNREFRRRVIRREREKSRERELAQAKEIEKAYTELKATQSQLIQSEKMASLGELTAGIAHEIQNPLNFVNNFAEINMELVDEMQEELRAGNIEDAIEISNDIKDNQQKINHHGKRAEAIVKGMLQHSRSNSGQKEPTDINALADEYFRLAYHGLRAKDKSFNVSMESEFDDSIGLINLVPQEIGRVILNLITNAFYACNERGKASNNLDEKKSGLEVKYQPTVWVKTMRNGNEVHVSIKDNGGGIPKSVVDKIFQPFFTTKPTGQGTGLGLSMSYDIVKAHGGSLKVETEEGVGTEFVIRLKID